MSTTTKNNIMTFIGVAAICVVLWPFLDLAFAKLILHTAFQYSLTAHLIAPLVFSGLYTYFNMITTTSETLETEDNTAEKEDENFMKAA
ncbi:MAG: hypothetical protein Q4A32_05235 [Lachnospiraceae bacterium]|nr:hypothetical protein [Lachnospiraceae bacterium]